MFDCAKLDVKRHSANPHNPQQLAQSKESDLELQSLEAAQADYQEATAAYKELLSKNLRKEVMAKQVCYTPVLTMTIYSLRT